MFEGLDKEILERIEGDKVWKFVDLDESSVKIQLAGLRSSVDWAQSWKSSGNSKPKEKKIQM